MKKYFLFLIVVTILAACDQKQENTKSDMTENSKMNPLLEDWNTPFGTAPLDKIKSEDYLPAIEEGIKSHEMEIDKIINNKEKPDFKNTLIALEESGKLLKKVRNVFDAVESANTDDVLKETSKKVRPLLTSHFDKIKMNKQLFEKVNSVYKTKGSLNLGNEDMKLLEEKYKSFLRSGVSLDEEKQNKLKEINKKLATLSQTFRDNQLEETNKEVEQLEFPSPEGE